MLLLHFTSTAYEFASVNFCTNLVANRISSCYKDSIFCAVRSQQSRSAVTVSNKIVNTSRANIGENANCKTALFVSGKLPAINKHAK